MHAIGVIAMLTLPLSGILILVAPELVRVTLGEHWIGMTVPFQVLIATLFFRTSYKISDSLTLALGSMYQRATRQWIYAAGVAGGALAGLQWGLPGVSAGVAAAVVLNFLMMLQLAMRLTGISWRRVLALHLRHALTAVPLIAAGMVAVSLARSGSLHDVLVLALVGASAALCWALMWWRCRWIFGEDGAWAYNLVAARVRPLRARPTNVGGQVS
jgi:PST family polysaccharide transporter